MKHQHIAHIRSLIVAGLSDFEIAELAIDDEANLLFEDMAYGEPDPVRDYPDHMHCDIRYTRNDAGEWLGFM